MEAGFGGNAGLRRPASRTPGRTLRPPAADRTCASDVPLAPVPADTTDDTVDTTPLPAGDGSVIASVVLDRATSVEVMNTLRQELRIARIATLGEKRIFLRDTDSQIQAALKVIGRVEGNREDS